MSREKILKKVLPHILKWGDVTEDKQVGDEKVFKLTLKEETIFRIPKKDLEQLGEVILDTIMVSYVEESLAKLAGEQDE